MRTLQKNSAFLSIELATKYYCTCCNAKSLVATTAITDDIHKLDLLGIPRQHTQIMHNHQRFLEQVEEMRQGIESHINQTRRALEQGKTTLQQQMQEWERCFKQAEWQQAFGLQQQYKILAVQVNHQIQEIEQRANELKDQGIQPPTQQKLAIVTDQLEKAHATIQEGFLQEVQHIGIQRNGSLAPDCWWNLLVQGYLKVVLPRACSARFGNNVRV